MRPGGRAAALAALVALAGTPAPAKPHRRAVETGSLPVWVREAAAAPVAVADAPLVVLHDERITTPIPSGGVRHVARWAARPLAPAALDDVVEYPLPYSPLRRDVTLRGWTVAPDGKSAVAPDPTLDLRDDPYTDEASVFDDTRVKWLRAANPAVGSVVAFEASWIDTLDAGAVDHRFGSEHHPVRLARLVVEIPEGWSGSHAAFGLRGVPCTRSGHAIECEARDVAPLPRDELRPPAREALATVWVRWWNADGTRGFRDWDAVGRWDYALAEPVLADVGEAAAIADRLRPSGPDDLAAAIERAFAFTARDVRYVSIPMGMGGLKPNPPAMAVARRFGDCKDKSFVLRAILERWGLETFFVDVLTRDAGVVRPEVPTFAQFNHMIAAVALPEGFSPVPWATVEVEGLGRLLLLDATSREAGPWALREDDQGTLGLVVHAGGGRLVRLPVQPPSTHRYERVVRAEVDDRGGLVSASFAETARESAGASVRSRIAPLGEAERRRVYTEWIQSRFPGSRLLEFTLDGADRNDRDVVTHVRLEGGWFGKRVAQMLLLEPGRGARGLFGGPLPASTAWSVRTGPPREVAVESSVRVPPGWFPEALPPPVAVEAPGIDGRASWAFEEGALVYRRTVRLTTDEVAADAYAAFREAHRRMEAADATAVVFVRAGG